MSNTSMGYAAQEQFSASETLFSADAARREIELEFISRFFARVSVPSTRAASPSQLLGYVDLLDSGKLDQVVEQFDKDAAPAVPQRFDEVPEFDYEAWRQRHR